MNREWYFVSQLSLDERPLHQLKFEIQLLNDHGQAIGCGYIGSDQDTLTILGRQIPAAVLAAAKLRQPKDGQYVDRDGNIVRPF